MVVFIDQSINYHGNQLGIYINRKHVVCPASLPDLAVIWSCHKTELLTLHSNNLDEKMEMKLQ